MKDTFAVVRVPTVLAALFTGIAAATSLSAGETYETSTTWLDRTITNQIEIRIPRNVYVNEYRTNWIERTVTKVIPVYATNQTVKTVTNQVVVNAFHTNFVNAYSTNWKTFTLTNWETVLVLKTNRVSQQLTNVEVIDLVAARVASPPTVPTSDPPAAKKGALIVLSSSAATLTDALLLEAVMTTPPSVNGRAEVQLSVKWAEDASRPLEVRQWRVEREDETVLCFGQGRQFKRELPVGEYTVEASVQRDAKSPLLLARGTLTITSRDAVIRQMPGVDTLAASAN